MCLSLTSFSQTIDKLEYELSYMSGNERYGDKINKARLLQLIDPFNYRAVDYICRYYYERNIDSISIYFDQFIQKFPNRPEPYILRANNISLEFKLCSDSLFKIKKEYYLKKALSKDFTNIQANYSLAELYYHDFIGQFMKPYKSKSSIFEYEAYNDSIEARINFPAKKAIFQHSADSALRYLQFIECLSPELEDVVYFPIKQLERYLDSTIYVKVDSLKGIKDNCFYPIWYFANLSPSWTTDYTIDYLFEIESSKSKIDWLKIQLEDLEEQCLYNIDIPDNNEIYRFTWLRSFDPPISIRLHRNNNNITLYWKIGKGEGGYPPKGLLSSGQKKVSISEWNEFLKCYNAINFEKLPNKSYILITDGATWTLEKKTPTYFKAHDTNSPDKSFIKCCMFMLSLTNLKVPEKDIY